MDFDEELSMKAAQKYSTDIQRATLFVLKNQNNQTDTTSNVIDEDKDDDKDDEKIITEGWLDLNNIPSKRLRKNAMTHNESSYIYNVNDTKSESEKTYEGCNGNINGTNYKIEGTKKCPAIDFSIFYEEGTEECNGNVNECATIKRLIKALLYYNLLTKRDNINGNGNECGLLIFSVFLQDIYPNYLNDYIHLTTIHDNDLGLVYEILCTHSQFTHCNVDTCPVSDRHCNISDAKNGYNINKTQKQISNVSSFHQQIFDTLHFYLLHLFELGLRQTDEEGEDEEEGEEDETKQDDINDNWQCFDMTLKKQRRFIQSKRKKFPRFSTRFEPQTNKFNIETVVNNNNNNNTTRDEIFNLDSLYQHISNIKQDICIDHIHNFQHYICAQEFDSDAIMEDFNEDTKLSNIFQSVNSCQILSHSIYQCIQGHILQHKIFFSTGFSFFYWPHFGDNKQTEIRVQNEQNRNEYGGYSPFQLFIKQAKYCNLKQEVLSNSEVNKIGINEYKEVIIKTNEYINTAMVKQIKYENDELNWDDIKYFDINNGASITKFHLHSLLFYTDYSELSTAFSKTFRKIKVSETLENVKERNRNYWWLSKLLIEAVNCFGSNNWENSNSERIKGPFYCGINMVMEVPSFMIRLYGPTSTTTQICVAANFAAGNGIILELNNISSTAVRMCRLFNVAWLSRYKAESECLFIGGQWPIEIISIRETATMYNFGDFFHCLSKYDAAINGDEGETVKGFSETDANKIDLLFKKDKTLPKYIMDTWNMFTFHKTTLIINLLYVIEYYPSYLRDLIVESTDTNGSVCDEDNILYVDITDNRNLLNGKVLMVFPRLTNIEIYCTGPSGAVSCQFGLCVLLDILNSLQTQNKIKCSLYGMWKDSGKGNKRSWLYYVYSLISDSLSIKYKTIKTSIQVSKDNLGYRRDLLIFEK